MGGDSICSVPLSVVIYIFVAHLYQLYIFKKQNQKMEKIRHKLTFAFEHEFLNAGPPPFNDELIECLSR
ncbi:hypothetical protein T06_7681 [Trichinella sp. T6]|nr:hypothetical protein T06_7681 [Trichinella sp. T6]